MNLVCFFISLIIFFNDLLFFALGYIVGKEKKERKKNKPKDLEYVIITKKGGKRYD